MFLWMVFLASYSRSVDNLFCVLSQSLFWLFVCFNLYRFAKSFKGSFLATFLESHFQHWQYHGVGYVSFLTEKAENCFCKYKILLPWIPYSAKELLFSSAVFWITQTLYCLQYYLSWKAHNLLLSVLLLWISSRPKIWVRTENNSLKEAHTLN